MVLTMYTASVSSNMKVKANQSRMKNILEVKKIEFEEKDITSDEAARQEFRDLGDGKMLPTPVICKDGKLIADFDAFDEANETDGLKDLLQLS